MHIFPRIIHMLVFETHNMKSLQAEENLRHLFAKQLLLLECIEYMRCEHISPHQSIADFFPILPSEWEMEQMKDRMSKERNSFS